MRFLCDCSEHDENFRWRSSGDRIFSVSFEPKRLDSKFHDIMRWADDRTFDVHTIRPWLHVLMRIRASVHEECIRKEAPFEWHEYIRRFRQHIDIEIALKLWKCVSLSKYLLWFVHTQSVSISITDLIHLSFHSSFIVMFTDTPCINCLIRNYYTNHYGLVIAQWLASELFLE